MCVIIHLKPKVVIPDHNLDNAIKNNPHGFGLIAASRQGLRVIHNVKKGKETELNEVKKVLKEHINKDRYLHLRYNTRGETSIENAHPFQVYGTKKNDVWMMHNGTFHGYGEAGKGYSDTYIFNEDILKPLISRLKFRDGFVDVNDPLITEIVDKYCGANNRVLLINKDNQPNFIGNWDDIEIKSEGIEFKASNNTYFNSVTRGKHAPTTRINYRGGHNSGTNHSHTPWQGYHNHHNRNKSDGTIIDITRESNKYHKFYASPDKTGVDSLEDYREALAEGSGIEVDPKDLQALLQCQDEDVWDAETFSLLSYVGVKEMEDFVNQDKENLKYILSTLAYMAFNFDSMRKQIADLEEDKEKSQQMIVELRTKNANSRILEIPNAAG